MMSDSQNMKAAILAMAASAILSFIDNFVGEVAKEAGLWQFQFFRMLFALPLLLIAARLSGVALKPQNLPRVVLRSLLVSTGLLIYFACLGLLPVAQAGAGLFSAPLWILVFSAIFFGQRVGLGQSVIVLFGFVGVLLLLQPDLSSLTPLSLLPVVAGAFYGLGMMATRHWCSQEGALILAIGVFLTIGLVGLVMLLGLSGTGSESSDFLARGWVTPNWRFLWLTFMQAVGAVIAVSLITQAYRIGEPGFVSLFEYSFLIFATLWALLLWDIPAHATAIFGIGIIILSGTALTLQARKKKLLSQ